MLYERGKKKKKLLVARFIEHVKTATLGKSYWEILPVLVTVAMQHCISAEFLRIEG